MPKLTALPTLTDPAKEDVVAVVDDSADTTKQMTLQTLMSMIYPIGSMYFNAVDDTNPSELLGFGTWVAYSKGQMPIGVDPEDSDFDTVGTEGGEKRHWHWQTVGADDAFVYARYAGSGADPVNTKVAGGATRMGVAKTIGPETANGRYDGTEYASSMPPHVVVYVWKRTA